MAAEFQNVFAAKIIAFLREIGIRVTAGDVVDATFLPGIEVINGGLVVDESKLLYPGDLLHEAGHLAVTPGERRAELHGKVEISDELPQVVELEAMLWSYAACLHLKLDPTVVFHEHGYRGQAD